MPYGIAPPNLLIGFGGFFGLFSAEKLISSIRVSRRPDALRLKLLEVIKMFVADNGPAFWKSRAAQERPFFALPDEQVALFAFVTLDAG